LAQSPIPNPQSPIPKSPFNEFFFIKINNYFNTKINLLI